MSGLFSHAAPEPAAGGTAADVSASVRVAADVVDAFSGFTEHLHLWWPAAELSVWGAGSFFDLEDGVFVETSTEDEEAVWAEVLEREDQREGYRALSLLWRHRPGTAPATSVSLSFTASGGEGQGTRVEVVHGGWTRQADPDGLRERYASFWPLALARYARFMGGAL
ncbi:SRPBCC family protein [Arthrobacter sp. TMN-37]